MLLLLNQRLDKVARLYDTENWKGSVRPEGKLPSPQRLPPHSI